MIKRPWAPGRPSSTRQLQSSKGPPLFFYPSRFEREGHDHRDLADVRERVPALLRERLVPPLPLTILLATRCAGADTGRTTSRFLLLPAGDGHVPQRVAGALQSGQLVSQLIPAASSRGCRPRARERESGPGPRRRRRHHARAHRAIAPIHPSGFILHYFLHSHSIVDSHSRPWRGQDGARANGSPYPHSRQDQRE